KLRTIYNQLNVGDFTVTAICYDPGLFGSISAYANLSYVNELMSMEKGEYKTLGIFLDNITDIDSFAESWYAALQGKIDLFERNPDNGEDRNPFAAMMRQTEEESWTGTRFRLFTLNDILSEVDQLVRLLNRVSLVILLVLFFIIMVGINNTFRMILFERIKEIGTMRALGMQKPDVNKLFLLEAFFLSIFGTVAGLALAGIIMFIMSRIFWGLDTPIYILLKNGYMTFRLMPLQVLLNTAIVTALTLFAAFLPTRKAAKMRPVEALYHV
ncbi:MAG: ABC transporter permease, partial [Spirochaetales bacterium]